MRNECIEAVSQAIGRQIKESEARGIEDRINSNMRDLARRNPKEWAAMTMADRLQMAAQTSGKQLIEQAEKQKQRIALSIMTQEANLSILADAKAAGDSMYKGIARRLDQTDALKKGIAHEAFGNMMDTINATEPRFFGMLEDAAGVRDLALEIFGKDTGNPAAKAGAKAWIETVEGLRQRFNRAGGEIGKLAYGYLPQPHDTVRIRKAGGEAWIASVLPKVDRTRYVNGDGSIMNDGELSVVLREVYNTIATEGVNRLDPQEAAGSRQGMLANRRADHRQVHFKDAESYLGYMADYGKSGVYGAMQAHIGGMARDIAMIENFGPNAAHGFEVLWQTAKQDGGSDAIGPFRVSTKDMYATLSGHTAQIYDGGESYQKLANIAQGVRNVEVFGKLQGALLSSVTDIPTLLLTARYNRLPVWETMTNVLRSFGGETKDYANRAGLISESIISDMNRWAEGNIGAGWTGKLANATMKLSLLEAWTEALRRGFSITMMGGMGKLAKTDWAALEAIDRKHLESKGITPEDWAIYRLAKAEDWRGSQMLTPESIRAIPDADILALGDNFGSPTRAKDAAVSKLLGAIVDESENAAINPDLYTRAAIERGTQKGTVQGEFLRSLMLFKGFPLAMISRHWMRAFEQEGAAGKLQYAAPLAVGLTMFGALAIQLKDAKDGKDPRDMTTPKFWGAAFVQGGGAGILGDVMYTGLGGQSRNGVANWTSIAGPVFGSIFELSDLTLGNLQEAMKGKETHAGAEALRFARSHLPFINLWYAKSAIDHAVMHDVQEMLSPGYLSKMQSRVRSEWNQDYWWRPGEGLPDRAPDLGKVMP